MKKTYLVRVLCVILITTTLSGCIWWVDDGGYRRGGIHERDRGGHYGDRHEDHNDRGGRR